MRNPFAAALLVPLLALAGCAPSAEPVAEPAAKPVAKPAAKPVAKPVPEPAAAPPKPEFETGKVIGKVVTRDDPAQSYALYLPKGYDPAKKHPILYGFSPGGRGTDPVREFRRAAEKYGWIVVGSNNSRNGPRAPITVAIKALMKDTAACLSIDKDRRYATGFSGGARVAFRLAATEKFAGVIPVGAGMSTGQKLPAKESGLAVFSMCGMRDFNHMELLRLERGLAARGLRQRMVTFNGRHQWPPLALNLGEPAVRYMELLWEARRNERDAKKFAAILALEMKDAGKLMAAAGQYMRGHARLKELVGLTNDDKFAKKLAAVEATARYKKEQALSDELKKLREGLAKITDSEARFTRSIAAYRKFTSDNKGADAVVRVETSLEVTGRRMMTGAMMLMGRKDYKRAEVYLKRARLFAPKNNSLAYNLACALARNGKKDEAVKQLAESVKLGFKKFEHMRNDSDLDTLREHPGYKKIVDPAKSGGAQKR